jgi:hypothetical protein
MEDQSCRCILSTSRRLLYRTLRESLANAVHLGGKVSDRRDGEWWEVLHSITVAVRECIKFYSPWTIASFTRNCGRGDLWIVELIILELLVQQPFKWVLSCNKKHSTNLWLDFIVKIDRATKEWPFIISPSPGRLFSERLSESQDRWIVHPPLHTRQNHNRALNQQDPRITIHPTFPRNWPYPWFLARRTSKQSYEWTRK